PSRAPPLRRIVCAGCSAPEYGVDASPLPQRRSKPAAPNLPVGNWGTTSRPTGFIGMTGKPWRGSIWPTKPGGASARAEAPRADTDPRQAMTSSPEADRELLSQISPGAVSPAAAPEATGTDLPGDLDLADRHALRRVAGLSTELADVTEV